MRWEAGLYSDLPTKSRLDICAGEEDAASISRQRNQNLRTGTSALEDRAEVLCLWARADHHGVQFPLVCPCGKSCCLVSPQYWPDDDHEPTQPPEQAFS